MNLMRLTGIQPILFLSVAALLGGCAATPVNTPHTTLTAAEITDIKHEQAQRLAGQHKLTAGEQLVQSGAWAPVVLVGMGLDFVIVEPIALGFDNLTGNTEKHAALMMVNADQPDQSREGIFRIAEFMQDEGVRPAYTNYLVIIARTSKDYTVRAAALRVLNEFRVRQVVPIAIEDMEYPQPLVQLEAAKALANIPDTTAIPVLVRHLKDTTSNADVRIACADALRNFTQPDSLDALTATLGDMDFSVAYQSRQSLRIATFHDFQYDRLQWQAFVDQPIRPTP